MRRSILASSRRRPLTLPGGLILIAPPMGPIDGWERPADLILLILQPGKGRLGVVTRGGEMFVTFYRRLILT